ncbi:hypothetical protein P154DRAFT_540579 [Amniculicola lignicola CBS 123094]|uniref:Uncharacterized protein n=1 Tax=Amniculicola lignicola CBS 123094 TaxID=1392246 RepID=A0A6A5VTX0_9PLEO|nr:hypothetical protein P154DRAFT_540579 [Amniculicola lignicola CBS 123094]
MEITREEAEDLLQRYPNCTWASLTYKEKGEAQNRITSRLAADKIAAVGRDILRWRMANVICNCKTTAAGAAARTAPGSAAAPSSAENGEEQTTRAYDPVRDV